MYIYIYIYIYIFIYINRLEQLKQWLVVDRGYKEDHISSEIVQNKNSELIYFKNETKKLTIVQYLFLHDTIHIIQH